MYTKYALFSITGNLLKTVDRATISGACRYFLNTSGEDTLDPKMKTCLNGTYIVVEAGSEVYNTLTSNYLDNGIMSRVSATVGDKYGHRTTEVPRLTLPSP